MKRWLRRTLPLGLLFVVFSLLGVGTAQAHSVLVSIDPPDHAAITAGPERVTVRFNENIQPDYAALTVVGPDRHLWSRSQPLVDGPTLSVALGDLGPAGTYTIAYRVTSADGHPVSGTRTFTLTTPGHGKPGPPASETSAGDQESGVPGWLWFVGGACVLVVLGVLAAVFSGRQRK